MTRLPMTCVKPTLTLSFAQVVEIPTIASFLACPDGTSLARLEKCKIIRGGLELCFYCHHLLRADKFSFFQRRITAARQMSLGYDYQSWKPEKHFCIDCGLKHHQYALGRPIDVGWVSGEAAIIPCQHCSEQFDSREVACTLCLGCPSCIAIAQKAFSDKEVPVAFISDEFCGHKAMIDSCKAFRAYGFGGSGEETLLEINGPEPEGDPDLVEYGNKPLHEILDFVGEKVKSVYCVETESG